MMLSSVSYLKLVTSFSCLRNLHFGSMPVKQSPLTAMKPPTSASLYAHVQTNSSSLSQALLLDSIAALTTLRNLRIECNFPTIPNSSTSFTTIMQLVTLSLQRCYCSQLSSLPRFTAFTQLSALELQLTTPHDAERVLLFVLQHLPTTLRVLVLSAKQDDASVIVAVNGGASPALHNQEVEGAAQLPHVDRSVLLSWAASAEAALPQLLLLSLPTCELVPAYDAAALYIACPQLRTLARAVAAVCRTKSALLG